MEDCVAFLLSTPLHSITCRRSSAYGGIQLLAGDLPLGDFRPQSRD